MEELIVLYKGIYTTNKFKKVYKYQAFPEGHTFIDRSRVSEEMVEINIDEEIWLSKSLTPISIPGSVWRVNREPSGAFVVSDNLGNNLGMIDLEQAKVLQAKSRAYSDVYSAHRRKSREVKENSRLSLEPLEYYRKAYRDLPSLARQQLIARIIEYVTR